MNSHDHASCRAIYVPALADEPVFSLRTGCDWEGHDDALAEYGWCPVCQH